MSRGTTTKKDCNLGKTSKKIRDFFFGKRFPNHAEIKRDHEEEAKEDRIKHRHNRATFPP